MADDSVTRDFFRSLFDPGIEVVQGSLDVADYALPAEEAAVIAGAGAKRRRDFAVGRTMARQALARFGLEQEVIPVGPDREPRWPSGIVGTISHAKDVCVVAVARRNTVAALGVDVEAAEPMPSKLLPTICTPREREWIARWPEPERGGLAMLLFTAKEAIYKCQFPLTRRFLEFEDVEVDFDLSAGRFRAVASSTGAPPWPANLRCDARFARSASHVASGITLYEPEAETSGRESRPR
jgi:4'-phosphopantetheinyl transferase EntD